MDLGINNLIPFIYCRKKLTSALIQIQKYVRIVHTTKIWIWSTICCQDFLQRTLSCTFFLNKVSVCVASLRSLSIFNLTSSCQCGAVSDPLRALCLMLIAHYSCCLIHFVKEEELYWVELDYRLVPPTETPCLSPPPRSKTHSLILQHNVYDCKVRI